MRVSLEVHVTKTFNNLTADELAEKLKTLDDDYAIDWRIEKEYHYDCDGFREFNGLYALKITTGICGLNDNVDVTKYAQRCYETLNNNI